MGWYERVPKEPRENAVWRLRLLKECYRDRALRSGVREACKRDLLFWTNVMLWTFDPRKLKAGENPHMPFVTWKYQDELLLRLQEHIGVRDIGIEKSRDMGASWLCLVAFLHQWQFKAGRAFMVVSRNERLVESTSDPDALFWKLDYLLQRQPPFLLPRFERTKLHLVNRDTGSHIDGASTTADVGRGGRRTAFLIDEYGAFEVPDSKEVNAATASNTECRLFNSTYKGTQGGFYEQMQRTAWPDDDAGIVKISLPWTLHPEKVVGHVRGRGGRFGWSPWYERMCRRLVSPALIAQEVDMDPQGAASPFFPQELLERLLREDARSPLLVGRLEYHAWENKPGVVVEERNGPLLLWMRLGPGGRAPVQDRFVVGADVGAGVGATPSVLSVADRKTREKVAELVTKGMYPNDFADLAVALCRFFNGAFLIWESNGMVGQVFGKRVVDSGYRNIYYRQDEQGLTHKLSSRTIPGWHASPENKDAVLGEYLRALASGGFVNRSRDALAECRQYVWLPNNHVENEHARGISDPATGGRNHGDRVIADALANKALGPEPEVQDVKGEPGIFDASPPAYFTDKGGNKWQIPTEYTSSGRMQKYLEEERPDAGKAWESSKRSLSGWETTQDQMGDW